MQKSSRDNHSTKAIKARSLNLTAESKAIQAHLAYVNYVTGKVDKIGVEDVLKEKENAWIKAHYMKVIDFAEQCQLKRISVQKDVDDEPMDKPFVVNIISSNDNAERKSI